MTLEEQTRSILNEVLITIPLARSSGTPQDYLHALMSGLRCFPVFAGWPSPVDGWLEEAERLCRELADDDSLAAVIIRRANVMMRRLELDQALAELDRVKPVCATDGCRSLEALTRARVCTRRHEFERARQWLEEATGFAGNEELRSLLLIARGELELEVNEVDSAIATLKQAIRRVPEELIEERVQVFQCLAFAAVSKADARNAADYLDRARDVLRGAGVWSEVAQMDVVVGSFELSRGNTAAAQSSYDEALWICEQHPGLLIEPVVRLGLARLRAATSDVDSAITESLRAATAFASQGNALGYIGVISFLHALYLEERNYVEAYRVLATGLAIAKKLGLPTAETILRAQVNKMRDETLGPKQFDDMVQKMIDELKQQKQSGEQPDPGADD